MLELRKNRKNSKKSLGKLNKIVLNRLIFISRRLFLFLIS
jgi:hypothetical protein